MENERVKGIAMDETAPDSLNGFIGNAQAVRAVSGFIRMAKERGTMPPHIAIMGVAGMGKKLLAELIALEMRAAYCLFYGRAFTGSKSVRDALLYAGGYPRTVTAIDGAHLMNAACARALAGALCSGSVRYERSGRVLMERIGKPFCVALLSDAGGRIAAPLLLAARKIELVPYSEEECGRIAWRVWGALGINASGDACAIVGRKARGVAAQAVRLAKEAHKEARRKGVFRIDSEIAEGVSA